MYSTVFRAGFKVTSRHLPAARAGGGRVVDPARSPHTRGRPLSGGPGRGGTAPSWVPVGAPRERRAVVLLRQYKVKKGGSHRDLEGGRPGRRPAAPGRGERRRVLALRGAIDLSTFRPNPPPLSRPFTHRLLCALATGAPPHHGSRCPSGHARHRWGGSCSRLSPPCSCPRGARSLRL